MLCLRIYITFSVFIVFKEEKIHTCWKESGLYKKSKYKFSMESDDVENRRLSSKQFKANL